MHRHVSEAASLGAGEASKMTTLAEAVRRLQQRAELTAVIPQSHEASGLCNYAGRLLQWNSTITVVFWFLYSACQSLLCLALRQLTGGVKELWLGLIAAIRFRFVSRRRHCLSVHSFGCLPGLVPLAARQAAKFLQVLRRVRAYKLMILLQLLGGRHHWHCLVLLASLYSLT